MFPPIFAVNACKKYWSSKVGHTEESILPIFLDQKWGTTDLIHLWTSLAIFQKEIGNCMLDVRKEIKEVIVIFCCVSFQFFLPHPDYEAEVDCIGGGQYIAKCYTASFEVMVLIAE